MELDFETLSRLAEAHGDAFYVVDTDRFRGNLRDLTAAFRARYPRTSLGYSYKTNYTPVLCRIADEEGCYAEVVSKMEYDLARKLGVDPERILFNGPLKTGAEIEEALLAGAVVNVDTSLEIEAVESVARRHPRARLRVGVRCHLDLDAERPSRFGVASEPDEIGSALRRLRALPGCRVQGLHCHFSAHRSLEAFRTRAERMVALSRQHFPDGPPPSLDLGGGLFGRLPPTLRAHFGGEPPSYADYAATVAPVLSEAFPGDDAPELILEPGAGVVADALEFVCRVAALKRLGDRQVAIATGSIQNIRATASPVNLPLRVVSAPDRAEAPLLPGPLDVTGYTCMETDVLQRGFREALHLGDFLVFENVGAYTTVFKPPFIRPAPAMVSHTEGRGFRLARRREELDDLLATYVT